MTHTQPDQLQFDGPGMPQVTPVLETPAAAIVVEINPKTDIDLMIRVANKGLMVMWINHRLIDRAENDVERSIVFYDEAKTFVEAVPSRLFPSARQDSR